MVELTPTPAQLKAIEAYARRHGRNWKAQLRLDWFYARTVGELQVLRNTLGPRWLDSFQLPKPAWNDWAALPEYIRDTTGNGE